MDLLKKPLKAYVKKQAEEKVNQEKVQATIVKSKKAFAEHESGHFLSYPEFLWEQGFYIRKRWWILQGLLLILCYIFLQSAESTFYMKRCIAILSSLFVILIMPELWKNCNTASMEIEGTSFFSLRKVYAARMFLFAMVDLLLLTLFFLTLGIRGQLTVGEMITSFFLPFMVTCCICFRSFCSQKAESEYLALFLCVVWTFLWVQVVLNETIYTAITTPVWSAAIIGAVVYLIYSIGKVWKRCEMIWEVEERWN